MQPYLQAIKERSLSQQEAKKSIDCLLNKSTPPAQRGAFLFAIGERPVSIEEWLGFAGGLRRRKKRQLAMTPSRVLVSPLPAQVADAWLAGWAANLEGISTTIQTRTDAEWNAVQLHLRSLGSDLTLNGERVNVFSLERYFPLLAPLFTIEAELGMVSWLRVAACLATSHLATTCLLSLAPDVWWEPVLHALRKLGVPRGVLLQQMPADPSRQRIVHFQGIAVSSTFVPEQTLTVEEPAKEWRGLELEHATSFVLLFTALLLWLGNKVESMQAALDCVKGP
jgi:hypothetical protein